jgi:predicted enzyme related to lactoylglutathione lyase
MELETVAAADLGRSLRGIGLNILTRDVRMLAAFIGDVFGLSAQRTSDDFALVRHDGMLMQLHRDTAFAAHPLHGLLPEAGPRGAGMQIYLFGIEPDAACARAEAAGGMVLEAPANKPHGLREATILAPEGQAFSPAVPVWA